MREGRGGDGSELATARTTVGLRMICRFHVGALHKGHTDLHRSDSMMHSLAPAAPAQGE